MLTLSLEPPDASSTTPTSTRGPPVGASICLRRAVEDPSGTHQLMRVHNREICRLLINQPPRSLKSIAVSVAYVAWLLGLDPSRRVIVVSYANELAAELHRQFRMIIDAPWYQAYFRPCVLPGIAAPNSLRPPAAAATRLRSA